MSPSLFQTLSLFHLMSPVALPVATADRAWAALDLGVAVEMIR